MPRTCGEVLLDVRSENLVAARSGPFAPSAPGRPGSPRPWRRSRPRRPACRETARTRILCSPSCSGPGEYRHPLPDHTSQKRGAESPERFGTSDCPPSETSCPPRLAEACRNSFSFNKDKVLLNCI